MNRHIYLSLIISILVIYTGTVSSGDTVENILQKAAQYGPAAGTKYDQEKACNIIKDALSSNKTLDTADRAHLLVKLAYYYCSTVRSAEDIKKTKALKYFTEAIRVMNGYINEDILIAKDNAVSFILDDEKRMRETARYCAELAMYRLMDDETFANCVKFRKTGNNTPATERIKILRSKIDKHIEVMSENLVFMAKRRAADNNSYWLELLVDTFKPGSMAQSELEKLPVEKKTATSGEKKKSGIPDKMKRRLYMFQKMRYAYPSAKPEMIQSVFQALNDKTEIPGQENRVRICDAAYCSARCIIKARHIGEYAFFRLPLSVRDRRIRETMQWWKANRDTSWQEIRQNQVETALERLNKKIHIESSLDTLESIIGYDLGYTLRVKLKNQDREQVLREMKTLWSQIKNKEWRTWKTILKKRIAENKKETDEMQNQQFKEAEKIIRAKIAAVLEKHPEIRHFYRDLLPAWQKTDEGRKKALQWIDDNRKVWESSPLAEDMQLTEKRLKEKTGAEKPRK